MRPDCGAHDTTDPRIDIVRDGYDAMADEYSVWASSIDDPVRERLVAELDARLPDGSKILDLGCGNGLPSTALLGRRHAVHGVDVSVAQVALARANVPSAAFDCADLLSLELPDAGLDAVTALYSLTHVPREKHVTLFARLRRWLRQGGLLLATLSVSGDSDGVQDEFIGVPMYFSGFDADTNRRLVREAGFALHVDETVTIQEPASPSRFLWVLAEAV